DKSTPKLDLSKESNLTTLVALMKWDMHPTKGASLSEGFDPDLFSFLLDNNGKITAASDVVYFKHKDNGNGAVVLPNDNRVGGGEGESMTFTLAKIPTQYS